MRHGSLFSGIGGFDLAAQWMGWENVFQVEIDPFCQKVLEKNFPNTKRYGDIKEFDGTKYRGAVDVLSGGFPCQPFSVAGSRKGKSDDRYLWPEMLRIIGEIRPSAVIGENVSGAWDVVDEICSNLEREGYTTEPVGIEAASVGANHRRLRYWFIAYSNSIRLPRRQEETQLAWPEKQLPRLLPSDFWTEVSRPGINRVAHGIPNRVDRIKSLGNAIVPQVAFEIFKAIEVSGRDNL
jgi:DNA-cytosine methyltransferase